MSNAEKTVNCFCRVLPAHEAPGISNDAGEWDLDPHSHGTREVNGSVSAIRLLDLVACTAVRVIPHLVRHLDHFASSLLTAQPSRTVFGTCCKFLARRPLAMMQVVRQAHGQFHRPFLLKLQQARSSTQLVSNCIVSRTRGMEGNCTGTYLVVQHGAFHVKLTTCGVPAFSVRKSARTGRSRWTHLASKAKTKKKGSSRRRDRLFSS